VGEATQTRISDCSMQLLRDAAPPFPGWGGTPGWIAPDGVELRRASTPQMDVYALGLISFFALTGHSVYLTLNPFDANTFRAELQTPIRSASARAKDLGLHLDPRLDPWFQSALAPEPGRRFESAGKLARSLEAILHPPKSAPASMHPPSIRAPRLTGDRSVAEATVQPLVFSEGRQDSLPPPQKTAQAPAAQTAAATATAGMATWILAGAILLLGALMVLVALAVT
jgi:serine/threonine-protein kinase